MVETAAEDGAIDGVERFAVAVDCVHVDVSPERLDERLRGDCASIHEATDLDLTGEGAGWRVWKPHWPMAKSRLTNRPCSHRLVSLVLTEAHVDVWLPSASRHDEMMPPHHHVMGMIDVNQSRLV